MQEEVKFYTVVVKLQEETDATDKAGNPKMKKWSESYLVRATDSQEADGIVRKEMEVVDAEWMIDTVKATKYVDVLNY